MVYSVNKSSKSTCIKQGIIPQFHWVDFQIDIIDVSGELNDFGCVGMY